MWESFRSDLSFAITHDGTVSDLLVDHYRLMAKSGVAMVVVENATVDHPTRK